MRELEARVVLTGGMGMVFGMARKFDISLNFEQLFVSAGRIKPGENKLRQGPDTC
jgi:hypothetical protein